MDTNLLKKLSAVQERYNELERLLSMQETFQDIALLEKYGKERAALDDVMTLYTDWKTAQEQQQETEPLLSEKDAEIRALAKEEMDQLHEKSDKLEQEIKIALLPKNIMEERDAIMTIQAGVGGDEAALFAGELFRMYVRYAERRQWKTDIIDFNDSGVGGYKEVVMQIHGKGAYSRLKFEGGSHRVQRVPVTESSGRLHTSTVKVIVMPQTEDIEIHIDDKDIRIDVFRSAGHGGQGVNTTDSAVRITHLPTGIVVTCQDERSKIQNLASAMSVLRSRLWDLEQQKRADEEGAARRSQVMFGDRAEKIRTYNFPQDRVTDHRINLSLHNLPKILDGEIEPLIESLIDAEHLESLQREYGSEQ